jgi:O-antigen/teichoic acid export membrane protein
LIPPLGRRTASGAFALGAVSLVGQALAVSSALFVLHVVGPQDYGGFAVGAILLAASEPLRGLGLGPAIGSGRLAERLLAAAHWASVLAATAVALVAALVGAALVLLAPALGAHVPALAVCCATIALGGWDAVLSATLARQGRFRAIAGVIFAAQVAGTVARVAFALAGTGSLSLAAGVGAATLTSVTALLLLRPLSLAGSAPLRELRGAIAEGKEMVSFLTFDAVLRNAGHVITGWRFGDDALGRYALASDLAARLRIIATAPLGSPLLNAYGALRDSPERFGEAVTRATVLLARVSWPLFALAILEAPAILGALGDGQWRAAVHLAQLLFVVGATQTVASSVYLSWMAQGAAALLARMTAAAAAASVVVLGAVALWGDVTAVATAWVALTTALLGVAMWISATRAPPHARGLAAGLARALRDAGLASGGVLLLRALAPPLPLFGGLAAEAIVFTAVYLALLRLFGRDEVTAAARLLPDRLQRLALRLFGLPAPAPEAEP